MIDAVWNLIIFTSMVNRVINNSSNERVREERRLRLFENRVLSRIFGPKREEVTGMWRNIPYPILCGW
jgi:hypothetical protein